MSDPGIDLQDAMIAALVADSSINVFFQALQTPAAPSDRILDLRATSPSDAVFPYVVLGEVHIVYDHADGWDGADNGVTIHVWSRDLGFREARTLGRLVERCLNRVELQLPLDRVVSVFSETSQYMRDPDGISAHGALRFSVKTEPKI